eukprot:3934037-Rhodomonas_salina.1
MELTSREHPEAVYKFDFEAEHPTMDWRIQQPYPGLSKTFYTTGEICEVIPLPHLVVVQVLLPKSCTRHRVSVYTLRFRV